MAKTAGCAPQQAHTTIVADIMLEFSTPGAPSISDTSKFLAGVRKLCLSHDGQERTNQDRDRQHGADRGSGRPLLGRADAAVTPSLLDRDRGRPHARRG